MGKPWSCDNNGGAPTPYTFIPVAPKQSAGTSLFCFTLINTAAKHEADLVDTQKNKKAGIFACDAFAVYKTHISRTNVTSFTHMWDDVNKTGEWKKHDWTVKVEPHTVFLPDRLRVHLAKLGAPINAALYVKYGTGNYGTAWLGVRDAFHLYSKNAVDLYFKNQKECAKYIKYWSHTFSIITCMDASDVGQMLNVNLTSDKEHAAECTNDQAVFFDPKDTPKAWLQCYKRADENSHAEVVRKYSSNQQGHVSHKTSFTWWATSGLAITSMCALGVASFVMRRMPVRRLQMGRGLYTNAAPEEFSANDVTLIVPGENDEITGAPQ